MILVDTALKAREKEGTTDPRRPDRRRFHLSRARQPHREYDARYAACGGL